MNEQIINKLHVLGGNTENVSSDKSFAENWQTIQFRHHLYDKDWDVYGIDQFYEQHENLYKSDRDKFYHDLQEHYFSDHELPYGQYFFRNWIFLSAQQILISPIRKYTVRIMKFISAK